MYATRFAPSPSGYLHLGHAFSAMIASDAAKAESGRFILRIEDIDHTRCRPEYEAAIYEDLAWLGIEWEQPVRRQSEHTADYQAALEKLRARGLLYRCFRTRREILDDIARAPHGLTDTSGGGRIAAEEEAGRLAEGDPFAWRLDLKTLSPPDLTYLEDGAGELPVRADLADDVVLARKDLGVSYHLAVVVDDALQGVTQVIRGKDLSEAVHVQRVLQHLLNLPAPSYRHHPLILGPDGQRLAKRDKPQTLRALREGGATPADIRKKAGLAG